jgi:hypothetical protein
MTFEEIYALISDKTRTDHQKSADLHATLQKALGSSQTGERKIHNRVAKKAKRPPATLPEASTPILNGMGEVN